MKPKCQHRWAITNSVVTDGKRVITITCPICGKEKTQKRKRPKPRCLWEEIANSTPKELHKQCKEFDQIVYKFHRNAPGSTAAKKKGRDNPRTKIKPVSDKQKVKNAEYSKLRKAFLGERKACEVEGCKNPSTEVHHKSRRHGKFFLDTSSWLAACSQCHRKIEDNPAWSKAMGYLQYHFS